VTQQSISEFAMVKVFAKLPNNSTLAATPSKTAIQREKGGGDTWSYSFHNFL
jgi:hypothetical protein